MEAKKEFWENLKRKYEEKNRLLRTREMELRHQLDAMETIIESSGSGGFRSCTCSTPPPSGGFFKCLMSMFPSYSKSPKSPSSSRLTSPVRTEKPTEEANQKNTSNQLCDCNPCMYDAEEEPTNDTNNKPQNYNNNNDDDDDCGCDPCPIDDENAQNALTITAYQSPKAEARRSSGSGGLGDSSKMSINSMDVFYMKNIEELVNQQKNLMGNIGDLEQKNKIFENIFKEFKSGQSDGYPGGSSCICSSQRPPTPHPIPDAKGNEELKIENFLLKHELKEMRLEVRQYLERMDLPMQYKIESERSKCRQLEIQLEQAEKNLVTAKEECQQEICKLQVKLCNANSKVYKTSKANEQLTDDLAKTQKKLSDAMDDLVRQKISEAETLRKVQESMNQRNAPVLKEDCSLYEIARELSKVLKECDPCLDCKHLPEDLTSAARLLKSLTDLVDQKIKSCESKSQPGEIICGGEDVCPAAELIESIRADDEYLDKREDIEEPPKLDEESPKLDEEQPQWEEPSPTDDEKTSKCDEEPVPLPLPTQPTESKRKCVCLSDSKYSNEPPVEPEPQQVVEQLWPATDRSDKLKLQQQIITTKSRDGMKSQTSLKCVKYKRDFPFNVDTVVDYINKKPDGVHVTTTITNSGTLEVITEGPEGMIETILTYTDSGHVEVLTHMTDSLGNPQTTNRGKFKAMLPAPSSSMPATDVPAIGTMESNSMPSTTIATLPAILSTSSPITAASATGGNCLCKVCVGK